MKKILIGLVMAMLLISGVSFAAETYNGSADIQSKATVESNVATGHSFTITHTYVAECYKADGTLRWNDTFRNLVVEAGLTKYLDATLKTGLSTPVWYVGLVTGPSETGYADTDTLASHIGWVEDVTSYAGTRILWDPTADSISCTGSGSCSLVDAAKSAFTIDSTCAAGCVVSGAFMASVSTGTAGTLLGVGAFTAGDRTVYEADTLNISVTATIAKP